MESPSHISMAKYTSDQCLAKLLDRLRIIQVARAATAPSQDKSSCPKQNSNRLLSDTNIRAVDLRDFSEP